MYVNYLFLFMISTVLPNPDVNMPTIPDTVTIKEWWVLGPFSIGVREGIIGVDEQFDLKPDFEPDTTRFYPTLLNQGGIVKWRKVVSEEDEVKIEYPNVMWDSLQDYYGVTGMLCAGYAYAELKMMSARRCLIIARGVSSFKLNNSYLPGDRYKDDLLYIPVVLKKGKNRILIKMSGFGDHNFSLKCIPCSKQLIIVSSDITKPDIISEEMNNSWLAIPVINTTTQRLNGIQMRISGSGKITALDSIKSIMPMSGLKKPVRINIQNPISPDSDSIKCFLEVISGKFSVRDSFWLKIKNHDEAHVRTFISNIDHSCQYYGVLPPEEFDDDTQYGLIMSCHGAGVKAENQISAYTPKEWAYVVAPTNRRRFGFNWQDWGRLDFLEVMGDVINRFNIDPKKVYLTGHSMGGHGAWHIGTSHPDIFAALAPSAGWTSIHLYIPYFLQKSYIFAHPEQLKFREMVTRKDNPLIYLENLNNLPTYILQGGADDNVPPIQGRMFAKYLKNLGYEYVYHEVEEQGHWWNIDSTPEVDCVDAEELMDFLRRQVRDPYPHQLVFKTSDIEHSNRAYWVRIDELENTYLDGMIKAQYAGLMDSQTIDPKTPGARITIESENINRFTLIITKELIPEYLLPGAIEFIINGQKIEHKCPDAREISFYKDEDRFEIGETEDNGLRKIKGSYGPIKRAYFSPFILVYGTTGDSASTEHNLHLARRQAYSWWYRANGYCEILPDTEVTQAMIEDYNLILFGNPWTNSIIKWINHRLPVRIEEGRIVLDKEVITKKDLCLIEIYPNPLNPARFICLFSPSSEEAEEIMGLFGTLYAGSGLPDFIVYDKSALLYGWKGVIAAGFFNKEWKFDPDLSYLRE